jgi:Flp pilus assembly protein TadG
MRAGGADDAVEPDARARAAGELMRRARRSGGHPLHALWRDERGLAATEGAIVLSILALASLNALELARWAYTRMQVANAAQMAVQNAYKTCDTQHLPATVNCTGLTSAIATSLAATDLGSAIQQETGSPSEGYYCVATTGTLTAVGSLTSKAADCSSAGDAAHAPADYLTVQVKLTYTPLASAVTIGALLPATIKGSGTMRME